MKTPNQAPVKGTPKVGQRGTVLINRKKLVQHVQETTPAYCGAEGPGGAGGAEGHRQGSSLIVHPEHKGMDAGLLGKPG
jgi:hypothetical protein